MSVVPAPSPRAAFTVDRRRIGDVLVVSITGRITEDFDGPAIARDLHGLLVFDLEKTSGITSFAVRSWVDMLSEARPRLTGLFFARCSQSMTREMNMVRNFTGGGRVLSFFAPYSCPQCELSYERLFDCARDADLLRRLEAPPAACPRCGMDGELDDDPASCFAVAANQALGEVPEAVRQVAEALGTSAEPSLRLPSRVDKEVEGRVTYLRINGRLDESLRWERITEGLRGHVVLDLSGVSEAPGIGVTNLHRMFEILPPDVHSIFLESCPQPLLERIASAKRITRLTVLSAVLPAVCPSCLDVRSKVLDVRRGAEALRRGESSYPCDRCGGALTFTKAMPLVRYLTAQDLHELPEKERRMPATVLAAPAIGSMGRLLLGAGAGVMVTLLAAVVLLLFRTPPTRPAEDSARSQAGQANVAHAAPDLPSAWAEQEPVLEGDALIVVGRGGPAPTEEAALAQAQDAAYVRLSEQMLRQLGGTLLYETVMSCCARPAAEPLDAAQSQRIAARFRAEVGALAVLERADATVRGRPGAFEALVRHRMPRAAAVAAADVFRATTSFRGLTVAPAFPLVAREAAPASGALVVGVRPRSAADIAGVHVGDTIVEVGAHRVVTARDFEIIVAGEWRRTAPGGRLVLAFDRAGAQRTASFAKPETTPVPGG